MLDEYKKMGGDEEQTIYCNCCAKPIERTKIIGKYVDHLHVEKAWGYFSSKDLMGHSFNICEKCYDEWISSFVIPVAEFGIEELRICSEEEMQQLNVAYAQQLAK